MIKLDEFFSAVTKLGQEATKVQEKIWLNEVSTDLLSWDKNQRNFNSKDDNERSFKDCGKTRTKSKETLSLGEVTKVEAKPGREMTKVH